MRARCAVLVGVAGLGVVFAAWEAARRMSGGPQIPQTGELELRILAPDGKPVANAEVLIGPSLDRVLAWGGPAMETARTDKAGMVVVSRPVGVQMMRVSVNGVGDGVTDLTQVFAGTRVQSSLPPLNHWAIIRGQLPPEFRTPDTQICISDEQMPRQIAVAHAGRRLLRGGGIRRPLVGFSP